MLCSNTSRLYGFGSAGVRCHTTAAAVTRTGQSAARCHHNRINLVAAAVSHHIRVPDSQIRMMSGSQRSIQDKWPNEQWPGFRRISTVRSVDCRDLQHRTNSLGLNADKWPQGVWTRRNENGTYWKTFFHVSLIWKFKPAVTAATSVAKEKSVDRTLEHVTNFLNSVLAQFPGLWKVVKLPAISNSTHAQLIRYANLSSSAYQAEDTRCRRKLFDSFSVRSHDKRRWFLSCVVLAIVLLEIYLLLNLDVYLSLIRENVRGTVRTDRYCGFVVSVLLRLRFGDFEVNETETHKLTRTSGNNVTKETFGRHKIRERELNRQLQFTIKICSVQFRYEIYSQILGNVEWMIFI